MKISISETDGQLAERVRRAEEGDEIVLTSHCPPTVRLVPVGEVPEEATRDKLVADLQAAAAKAPPGPSAAHSQDFLDDDDGLPA